MMKIISFLLLFLVFKGLAQPAFDRKTYYDVLRSGKMNAIDRELAVVAGVEGNDGLAYSGTLLMRKAGLLKVPREKLAAFKSGRIKLETAIRADSGRVEYHFLRLIIQEHSPKIVKYRDQVERDRELIDRQFGKLPADLQAAIKDYRQG